MKHETELVSQLSWKDLLFLKNTFAVNQSVIFPSFIQLLESPIPAAPPAPPAPPAVSQKASSDDISGTKRDTIDPLVSKPPEKILNKKIKKKQKNT